MNKKIIEILIGLFIVIIYSISIKYTFNKIHDAVFYDFYLYLPAWGLIALVVYILFIVSGIFFSNNKIYYMLLIPFIYVIEVLVNYPYIRARDVYLHGQIWELDITGSINLIHYQYPKEHPGFFLELYLIKILLGISDIRVANLFVLYPVLMIILVILYYLFSNEILGHRLGASIAVIIGFNLVMFHRNELTFHHANTRLFAIILIFIITFLIIKIWKERLKAVILFSVVNLVLVLSHPLYNLSIPVALIAIYILNKFNKNNSKNIEITKLLSTIFLLSLMSTIIIIVYNFYNYYILTISVGLKSFFDYIYRQLGLELLASSISVKEELPVFGVIIRNYYKVLIIVLSLIFLFYSISSLVKQKINYNISVIISFALALVIVHLVTLFSASLGNSINRLLISYPFYLSLAVIYVFISNKFFNIFRKVYRYVLIFILMLMILIHFIFVHEKSILPMITQPLDNAILYVLNYREASSIVITVTSPFDIYYSYYNPGCFCNVIPIDSKANITTIANKIVPSHGIIILDIRSIVEWASRYNSLAVSFNEWQNNVFEKLYYLSNLVYLNGIYENVFFKSSTLSYK